MLRQLDTSAADEAHQDHDDGDNQQNVDESANCIGSDQAKQPQDQKYDGDCIEHDVSSVGWLWATGMS
jgi:hypothetical protein